MRRPSDFCERKSALFFPFIILRDAQFMTLENRQERPIPHGNPTASGKNRLHTIRSIISYSGLFFYFFLYNTTNFASPDFAEIILRNYRDFSISQRKTSMNIIFGSVMRQIEESAGIYRMYIINIQSRARRENIPRVCIYTYGQRHGITFPSTEQSRRFHFGDFTYARAHSPHLSFYSPLRSSRLDESARANRAQIASRRNRLRTCYVTSDRDDDGKSLSQIDDYKSRLRVVIFHVFLIARKIFITRFLTLVPKNLQFSQLVPQYIFHNI